MSPNEAFGVTPACAGRTICSLALILTLAFRVHAEDAAKDQGSIAKDVAKSSDTVKKPAAGEDTVKMVKFFLASEIADLPPERIPDFLEVDPDTLPIKLQDRFLGKKAQLLALKRTVDGRRKPAMRRNGLEQLADKSCSDVMKMKDPGLLLSLGFAEISDSEELWLMKETKCNECELIMEFSLTIAIKDLPKGSKKKAQPRYFLTALDPLLMMVQLHRQGKSSRGTNFFGVNNRVGCR